jgi:hypothetical protein
VARGCLSTAASPRAAARDARWPASLLMVQPLASLSMVPPLAASASRDAFAPLPRGDKVVRVPRAVVAPRRRVAHGESARRRQSSSARALAVREPPKNLREVDKHASKGSCERAVKIRTKQPQLTRARAGLQRRARAKPPALWCWGPCVEVLCPW